MANLASNLKLRTLKNVATPQNQTQDTLSTIGIKSWPWVWRLLLSIVGVGILVGASSLVCILFSSWHPILDLVTHTTWHLFWGMSGVVLFATFFYVVSNPPWKTRWRDRCVAGGIVWLVLLVICQPWKSLPVQSNVESTSGLRLLTWNVWQGNQSLPQQFDRIRELNPDVIVLIELAPWHEDFLIELAREYPSHRWELLGAAGIGVFSRIENTQIHRVDLQDASRFPNSVLIPAMDVQIPESDTSSGFHILAVHTMSPSLEPERTWERDAQLAAASDWVAIHSGKRVVLGDLNITPWSRPFSQLLFRANLRDSRDYRGHFSSWPTSLGMAGIPIDHVLISPEVEILYRGVYPLSLNSDHQATLAVLR